LGPAHTTPEEFENGGFTLKTHQLFSVHSTPDEFKKLSNHQSFWQTRPGKSRDSGDVIVFKTERFQNVFPPHQNAKPAFSNSAGLKSAYEKFRYRDGLVWTVGLTVEINLRFQIPLACGQSLNSS